MAFPLSIPTVDVREILPALGFVPTWGTATDQEPAFAFKGGGIDILVAQVTSLYLRPEFLIGGVASSARAITHIEQSMPLALDSRDQIVAWLAFAVGTDFRATGPVEWLDEGKCLQHLLPWVQERERRRVEAEAAERLRLLRPHCTVERHWLRKLLNTATQLVGWPPAPGHFLIAFDGEMLKTYLRGRVLGAPAIGAPWRERFQGDLRNLHSLPRRISIDPIEVGIWHGQLEIERVQIPVVPDQIRSIAGVHTVKALNSTPLSRHIETLLRAEKALVQPWELVLVDLMAWAAENYYSNTLLGEMELGAVVRAVQDNPQAVYDNLADDRMLDAATLAEASAVLVASLSDMLDDRSISNESRA